LDESAQPLLPSPFLREIEQAFGSETIPRVERADLSPVPKDDEPLCEADFRVKAVATALEGNIAMLAGLMQEDKGRGAEGGEYTNLPPSHAPHPTPLFLASGLESIYLRQDHNQFSPAEGILQSPESHSYLASRFPPQHVFAATDLERYAACPFQFFMERILEIEPIEDLALEFDVRHRGRVVHDVLAMLHRRINERFGRPASPLELEAAEFDAMLAAAIADSLPPAPKNPVQAALREVDRRLVVEWLGQYRSQWEKYAEHWDGFSRPMMPELFEASFGRNADPQNPTDRPLEFSARGQTVRIAGRIDRVDTGVVAGETAFNIIDYKTGGSIPFSSETIRAGITLQLPLYVFAVLELLLSDRDAVPWWAGYWYVRDKGLRPKQVLRMYRNDDGRIELESEWETVRAGLGETVVGLVYGIRYGQFPVCCGDEYCTGRCPFNTVCRIHQVRSLEKTWRPTAE
jgi:RecB family exonuclease